jgi:hypothetical protein
MSNRRLSQERAGYYPLQTFVPTPNYSADIMPAGAPASFSRWVRAFQHLMSPILNSWCKSLPTLCLRQLVMNNVLPVAEGRLLLMLHMSNFQVTPSFAPSLHGDTSLTLPVLAHVKCLLLRCLLDPIRQDAHTQITILL